jgi:carboxyl-terminal processing protease
MVAEYYISMIISRVRPCPISRFSSRYSYLLVSGKLFLSVCLALLFLFSPRYGSGDAQDPNLPANYETNRAKLLTFLIRNSLESNHFAQKIDDKTSEAAFGLYLKQLDFQKRILLMEDVVNLRKYSRLMDDEMNSEPS